MNTYLILSHIENQALQQFGTFRADCERIEIEMKTYCPDVTWETFYTTSGPGDVLHVLSSSQQRQLEASLSYVLSLRHMTTLLTMSTSWHECQDLFDNLGVGSVVDQLAPPSYG